MRIARTKLFLNSADVAAFLGVSVRQAQYILNALSYSGKTIQNGSRKMVSASIFADYLCAQDGENPSVRYDEIKRFLSNK